MFTHTYITVQPGCDLHVVLAGPHDGPPLVLLHGFPEFWRAWHAHIQPLAHAGFRVIVPDQRGYNLSDRPPAITDYTTHRLALDIVTLLDALHIRRATVVGHDWGGGVTWELATQHPHRLSRALIINCPHPAVFRRFLFSHRRQLLHSYYMFFFQLPHLPERACRHNNFARLIKGFSYSRPNTFSDDDLQPYREAWSRPGALSAMLNWYRAAVRHPPTYWPLGRVSIPLRLIWGLDDAFLARPLAALSIDMCDHGELITLDGLGHWLLHEDPDRVRQHIVDFLDQTEA